MISHTMLKTSFKKASSKIKAKRKKAAKTAPMHTVKNKPETIDNE